MKKVAFFAYEGCAIWQVALLLMILEQEQCSIRTLTLGGLDVRCAGGLRLQADIALEQAAPRDYDLLVMVGGPINATLAEDTRVHRFLRQFDGSRGRIAASCTSSIFLAASGLLGGLAFTALPETVQAFADWYANGIFKDEDVTTDGNITTAKGHAYVSWTGEVLMHLGYDAHIYQTKVRALAGRV